MESGHWLGFIRLFFWVVTQLTIISTYPHLSSSEVVYLDDISTTSEDDDATWPLLKNLNNISSWSYKKEERNVLNTLSCVGFCYKSSFQIWSFSLPFLLPLLSAWSINLTTTRDFIPMHFLTTTTTQQHTTPPPVRLMSLNFIIQFNYVCLYQQRT